ncbi:hypothetical protein FISHEDRAFT_71732 [Fistulina hepatica ATCC 64428]|uniref:Uncharacterized protein n=1 Tax=Fistulina hepatica ATCC 64428 TaxID=1128425 RepID=A0A0D7AGY9_9AGAR|nr:hypothetical protein FISHEDRAFT_71732 [Fistulina hepatica ATCC 64428]
MPSSPSMLSSLTMPSSPIALLSPTIPSSPVMQLDKLSPPSSPQQAPNGYRDELPQPPPPVDVEDEPASNDDQKSATPPHRRLHLLVRDRLKTAINAFGLWCEYLYAPSYDPDVVLSVDDMSNCYPPSSKDVDANLEDHTADVAPLVAGMNASHARFMGWVNNGVTHKLEHDTQELVDITVPFRPKVPSRITMASNVDANLEDHTADVAPLVAGMNASHARFMGWVNNGVTHKLEHDTQELVDITVPFRPKVPSRITMASNGTIPGVMSRRQVVVEHSKFKISVRLCPKLALQPVWEQKPGPSQSRMVLGTMAQLKMTVTG